MSLRAEAADRLEVLSQTDAMTGFVDLETEELIRRLRAGCLICGCALDTGDPGATDCGGDCWTCVRECESD